MTRHGHASGWPNMTDSGTVSPWSTGISLTRVRSNSSRISDSARCQASSGWPCTDGHRAGAVALVGRRELVGQPERERGDDLERERGGVVVVDDDADVGLDLGHPGAGRLAPWRSRAPSRGRSVLPLSMAAPTAGHVRAADAADEPGHQRAAPTSLAAAVPVGRAAARRASSARTPRRSCRSARPARSWKVIPSQAASLYV